MSLLDGLQDQLGGDTLSALAGQLGTDTQTTKSAVDMALPLLLGGLASNSAKPGGAQALGQVLQRDHDGSLLGNLAGFLGGAQGAATGRATDGAGILGHVFGKQESSVANGIEKATGMNSDQSRRLLTMLAPVVLAYLGRNMRQKNMQPEQLGSALQEERGTLAQKVPGVGGMLGSLLDRDGDGSVADDIASAAPGLLGNLFGGKR